MLKSDLCDFSDVYIVPIFLSLIQRTQKKTKQKKQTKVLHLKLMHHLTTAFQKSMAYKLAMQKTKMM